MSCDAILQVSKAEETARANLLQAQNTARERVTAAQNAATDKLAAAKKQLAGESALAVAQEREKNEAYAAGELAKTGQDCDRLREQAMAHMDKAVARIMERVMG